MITATENSKYNKELYGEIEIEPVIKELLDSAPLRRLKHIEQHGPMLWVWPRFHMTRYEHSLGVYFLLKHLGAPLKEQIAGLLHDVSHTAFSHVIDYVFDKITSGDFHEEEMERIVYNSIIPDILKRHGFNVEEMFNHKTFPLLERDLPDLCADRVDYFLRDTHKFGLIKFEAVQTFFTHLDTHENQIILTNKDVAYSFATQYLHTASTAYGSNYSRCFYTILAEAIQIAFEENILSKDDLFLTDDEVRQKLIQASHPEITHRLSLISKNTKLTITTKDQADYTIKGKVRVIDPPVRIENRLFKLSEIHPSFQNDLEISKRKQAEIRHVKIS